MILRAANTLQVTTSAAVPSLVIPMNANDGIFVVSQFSALSGEDPQLRIAVQGGSDPSALVTLPPSVLIEHEAVGTLAATLGVVDPASAGTPPNVPVALPFVRLLFSLVVTGDAGGSGVVTADLVTKRLPDGDGGPPVPREFVALARGPVDTTLALTAPKTNPKVLFGTAALDVLEAGAVDMTVSIVSAASSAGFTLLAQPQQSIDRSAWFDVGSETEMDAVATVIRHVAGVGGAWFRVLFTLGAPPGEEASVVLRLILIPRRSGVSEFVAALASPALGALRNAVTVPRALRLGPESTPGGPPSNPVIGR